MNSGWVFCDGVFYCKYEHHALAECRKDRDAILMHIDRVDASMLNDPDSWPEFEAAVRRACEGKDDAFDLMTIAFQTDYCYYTEWDDDDDFQYEEVEPCDECGYYDDATASHYEECSKLNNETDEQ